MKNLIHNGIIVSEQKRFEGYIITENERIIKIGTGIYTEDKTDFNEIIDAEGGYILPGVIDDQVHFREPGLTYKGDIASESRAAIAGGVTSYMEMPNTKPPTTTIEELNRKFERAAETSMANYSFYFGATNDNADTLSRLNVKEVCGVKVFMGSSTGNMLVDNSETLARIFSESPLIVATHCEEESIIRANRDRIYKEYDGRLTTSLHPVIRSEEACYASSAKAVELAAKYNTRLHILHLSTERELSLFSTKPLSEKRITSEICVHHLWFSDRDYATKGNFILWNPAIKRIEDRDALRRGVLEGKVDVIATDHAPHSFEEKSGTFPNVPSGGPLVQHSLTAMMEMSEKGLWSVENVVEKMCHAPKTLFRVKERGYIREGYFADIAIVKKESWNVEKSNILYKCGWSPFEGETFSFKVTHTIVNGAHVYNKGEFNEEFRAMKLEFEN